MTDIISEIQQAELQIRDALRATPGEAMQYLLEAYESRDPNQREAFMIAIIGNLVSSRIVSIRECAKLPTYGS